VTGKAAPGEADAGLPFAGSVIVLGVCGGIAAYKAVELCRRLVDAGAQVVPVPTADALRFVGEVTFSALGSEHARTSLFDDQTDPIPHISLAKRADLVLIAPATAHLIGQYRGGLADSLLTATLLATRAPVVICPAMHTEMWEHPAVQDNLRTLRERGVGVVPPESGRLAGGDSGAGRLAPVESILAAAEAALSLGGSPTDLTGVHVLVTAGGTREPIDPVRYIGNRSSGRQGHAIAAVARSRGADVTLVTSSKLPVPPSVEVVHVETAAEMGDVVLDLARRADIVIMAAAVADFRPTVVSGKKLHKSEGVPEIALEPTIDVLSTLAARRHSGQVLVGFAAETGDLRRRALEKLTRKGVDVLVANDVSRDGVGFSHETNAVTILVAGGASVEVPLSSKHEVASAVLDVASERLRAARAHEDRPNEVRRAETRSEEARS
jgi:phosphopantothenoylcysteine decarboxylase / phosphopantothenate---cysteine ligase